MSHSDAALPVSRTAYVLSRLKADLEEGVISPGEQIRQTALAKRYGVSPTPVREALRILAADGTIDYTSHRGATVRDFTPVMAHDLYRMRAELEGLACEIATERMTDEDFARVLEANETLVRATEAGEDPARLSLLNREFHFSIYASTSSVVEDSVRHLWERFKPSVTLWGVTSFSAALDHDHDGIIEALERRDGPAARLAMRAHVLHAWELRQTNDDLRAKGGDPVAPDADS
ncbi:GntR family transcriptional regulator [Nocardioides campestrisoli]|uniref:GntR family transcriptional regulator n=1 Tax=Nocardioides campestrisoli TaxID=2736757 RepID=UPI0015E7A017|nr:GntR family transcriptional regulator [Nocardioides campestrisoli]